MNRVFLAMFLIGFLAAGWRQAHWTPPVLATTSTIYSEMQHSVETLVDFANQDGTLDDQEMARQIERVETEMALLRAGPNPKACQARDAEGQWKLVPCASPMQELAVAMLEAANGSVTLAIGLIGVMALFLGLVKIAEAGGLMAVLAKLIRPVMIRLFPDVPPDHPAMGAIILNLSANAMGLGNAATPFGIRAMQQLDSLNRHRGTASNAMVLFLAINTSNVSLLPTGVIGIRTALGSTQPASIIPTTLLATLFSTIVAITAVKLYQRMWRTAEEVTPLEDVVEIDTFETPTTEEDEGYPLWVTMVVFAALFAWVGITLTYGESLSPWMIPSIAIGMLLWGALRGVRVYESFVEGAKDGWQVAVKIVPYLVGILTAVAMLRASGALDAFVWFIDPITSQLGLPAKALPMALLRPLSGSGALGIMTATMQDPAVGPDSYTGYLVSTLQGSTETTFYVLAVYFGAVQIRRIRHAMVAALTADLAGIIGAIGACSLYFWLNG